MDFCALYRCKIGSYRKNIALSSVKRENSVVADRRSGLNGYVTDVLDRTVLQAPEELVVCHDRATGLRAVIAVDDTTLGPGLGGVRWMPYPDEPAAVAEACRLARVMTLKNALADLPYGGAKSVILREPSADGPPLDADRRAVMTAFGRFVARLGGAYVPGVDMGTTVDDLAVIGSVAPDVSCDRDDPSPATALGVFVGLRAAVAQRDGREPDDPAGLTGCRVLVQGAGHVGADLGRRLAAAGAIVAVADVDPARAAVLAAEVGGTVVDPDAVATYPCDVWAPCATARVIDADHAAGLGCRIVAGAANDVLAERRAAAVLADQGVTYVPDFLLNAGGVVHIHAVRSGWGDDRLEEAVRKIGGRVHDVLALARASGKLPIDVAEERASARLGRSIGLPA
jgi:leucine dehydrogenase